MLLIPSITFVQIKGNIVRSAMNTGTELVLSQIKASRITATTGVDLMVTKMGFKKALKFGLTPASMPNERPSTNERINPIMPLAMVTPTVAKKPTSVNSLSDVNSVFSGAGSIKSELK
jgi:hypothetical protein